MNPKHTAFPFRDSCKVITPAKKQSPAGIQSTTATEFGNQDGNQDGSQSPEPTPNATQLTTLARDP